MEKEKERILEEAISKERQVVERIAKLLKEIYGKSWNFEIDFLEGGKVEKSYALRVKIYKK